MTLSKEFKNGAYSLKIDSNFGQDAHDQIKDFLTKENEPDDVLLLWASSSTRYVTLAFRCSAEGVEKLKTDILPKIMWCYRPLIRGPDRLW